MGRPVYRYIFYFMLHIHVYLISNRYQIIIILSHRGRPATSSWTSTTGASSTPRWAGSTWSWWRSAPQWSPSPSSTSSSSSTPSTPTAASSTEPSWPPQPSRSEFSSSYPFSMVTLNCLHSNRDRTVFIILSKSIELTSKTWFRGGCLILLFALHTISNYGGRCCYLSFLFWLHFDLSFFLDYKLNVTLLLSPVWHILCISDSSSIIHRSP